MEIIYGILGVFSLGLFAAILGFDLREIAGTHSKADKLSWMYDDPNSTIGVTREVLTEQGEPWRAAQLTPAH